MAVDEQFPLDHWPCSSRRCYADLPTQIEVYVKGNANPVTSYHDPAAQGVALFSTGGACTLEDARGLAKELPCQAWQCAPSTRARAAPC